MKIYLTGIITEIVHTEDFDSMTVENGKRKSRIKVEAGTIDDGLLSTAVYITVESQATLFPPADPETGEIKTKKKGEPK